MLLGAAPSGCCQGFRSDGPVIFQGNNKMISSAYQQSAIQFNEPDCKLMAHLTMLYFDPEF